MKTFLVIQFLILANLTHAEEKKREPAEISGVKIQSIYNSRRGIQDVADSNFYSRIVDTKTNIVCYTVTNSSGSGGTSIACLKVDKLPEQ